MVRNPFKKEDRGLCFCIIMAFFIGIQAVYYFFYLDLVYIKDFNLVLLEKAEEEAFIYDKILKKFTPEIPDGSPLLQDSNFLN